VVASVVSSTSPNPTVAGVAPVNVSLLGGAASAVGAESPTAPSARAGKKNALNVTFMM
jgi:hypothetical protein